MTAPEGSHPYRTLAEVVRSVREHTGPTAIHGDLLDDIRELRELLDQGMLGDDRDTVAGIIKSLSEIRDDLVRRYAAIEKLLTWFSSGVGTAGGVASIAAVASRSGLVMTAAVVVLTVAIVLMARVILAQIEPWTLVMREIEGAVVDLRKQAHAMPTSGAVQRAKLREEMEALGRRLDAHESRVSAVEQARAAATAPEPSSGVRVTEGAVADTVPADDELAPGEKEQRGTR